MICVVPFRQNIQPEGQDNYSNVLPLFGDRIDQLAKISDGNLDYGCTVTDVDAIFSPAAAPGCPTVERIDLKRGFAFVFFNDAAGDSERDAVEALVSDINGR